MKKTTVLVILLLACGAAGAQTRSTSSVNNIPRAEAAPTLTVAKEGLVVGYEKVIAAGRLSFSKSFTPNTSANEHAPFTESYFLSLTGDNSFNNRKPVKIGLSRKSFDSVFTRGSAEMATKYPALNNYVTANKISLSEESGWVKLINFFNQL